MLLGSHLSIAGGMHRAIEKAHAFGFDTAAVFVRNQVQWRAGPLSGLRRLTPDLIQLLARALIANVLAPLILAERTARAGMLDMRRMTIEPAPLMRRERAFWRRASPPKGRIYGPGPRI